jgi:hypothetical protein
VLNYPQEGYGSYSSVSKGGRGEEVKAGHQVETIKKNLGAKGKEFRFLLL